jgi:phospholipid-transporting ATPase
MTNIQILFLFGLLITLSVACALGTFIMEKYYGEQMRYVTHKSSVKEFFFNILTFLILFNNLIPIR